MLFAEPLINLKLLLGAVPVAGANISLAEAIVSVGKIGTEFQRARILGDGLGIFILVGVEIAQLQVRLRELGVDRQRFAQQRFDLMKIEIRILGTRSEEHTSELQSRLHLVCRLLLEKKKKDEMTDIGVVPSMCTPTRAAP